MRILQTAGKFNRNFSDFTEQCLLKNVTISSWPAPSNKKAAKKTSLAPQTGTFVGVVTLLCCQSISVSVYQMSANGTCSWHIKCRMFVMFVGFAWNLPRCLKTCNLTCNLDFELPKSKISRMALHRQTLVLSTATLGALSSFTELLWIRETKFNQMLCLNVSALSSFSPKIFLDRDCF